MLKILGTNSRLWCRQLELPILAGTLLILFSPPLFSALPKKCINSLQLKSEPVKDELKKNGNRFRNYGSGVSVTPEIGKAKNNSRYAQVYIQTVLDHISTNILAQSDLEVKIKIYSSNVPNAFATKTRKDKDTSIIDTEYLGTSEAGKRTYEIGILPGIFKYIETEDELAFLLGHELGHILEGHLEGSKDDSILGSLNHWADSQEREVDADLKALELMLGKYELNASFTFLSRVLDDLDTGKNINYFESSHHHPSLRLAIILGKIKFFQRTESEAQPRESTPLEKDKLLLKSSPRQNRVTPDYAHSFIKFNELVEKALSLQSSPINLNGHWPLDPIFEDVSNAVFAHQLETIVSSELSTLEQLNRIFELLFIYSDLARVVQTTGSFTTYGPAFKYLSRDNILLVDQHLRTLGFGKTNPWTPELIWAQLDLRLLKRNSVTGQTLTSKELLGDLLRSSALQNLFIRYADHSKRWQSMVYPKVEINEKMSIEMILPTVRSAFQRKLSDENSNALIKEFDKFNFEDQLKDTSSLSKFQDLFLLINHAKDQCSNPTVCAHLLAWSKGFEARVKLALMNHLESYMQMNPEQVDRTVLGQIGDLFDRGPFRYGLGPQDFNLNQAKMVYDFLNQNQIQKKPENQNHLRNLSEITSAIFARYYQDLKKTPSNQLLFQLASPGNKIDLTSVFQAMNESEIESLMSDFISFQVLTKENIDILAQFTSIPSNVISELGLSYKLLDKFIDMPSAIETAETANKETSKYLTEQLSMIRKMMFIYDRFIEQPQIATVYLSKLDLKGFGSLLSFKEDLRTHYFVLDRLVHPHLLSKSADLNVSTTFKSHHKALLDKLKDLKENNISFANWSKLYGRLIDGENLAPEVFPLQTRTELSEYVDKQIELLPMEERSTYLFNRTLFALLPAKSAARFLKKLIISKADTQDQYEQAKIYKAVRSRLDLSKDFPDVDSILKEEIAEAFLVQPGQLSLFFDAVEKPKHLGAGIRGFSGIIGEIQNESVNDQLEFIDYITGRMDQIPSFLTAIGDRLRTKVDPSIKFEDYIVLARTRLMRANPLERGGVLLPFFVGKNSILNQPSGHDLVLGKILKSVSPRNRRFAEKMARGILKSEGSFESMLFSLILGLKGDSKGELTEGEILRAFLSYGYGVPGIKLGQYLAFTTDFKNILGELQDQALPLSYYESIVLLEKHFPNGLSDGLRILGIKGTGSVNIAIEYYNPTTNQNEIMSVPRENVETTTDDDFRRLKLALEELVSDPEGMQQFGFMLGLLDTIYASVKLEFNRTQVYKNQSELNAIYNDRVDGWNVKMVNTFKLDQDKIIRMEMAKGVPARLVESNNPSLYRDAMGAAAKTITRHLLRIKKSSSGLYYADSDFHNGQVFIDQESKTVWLIDPGQSIAINEEEFNLGQTIMRALGNLSSVHTIATDLNNSSLTPQLQGRFFSEDELRPLLTNRDKSDAFIRFVSLATSKGAPIPLPTVQLVLGMNRQLKLDEKINSGSSLSLWMQVSKSHLTQTIKNPNKVENWENLKIAIETMYRSLLEKSFSSSKQSSPTNLNP